MLATTAAVELGKRFGKIVRGLLEYKHGQPARAVRHPHHKAAALCQGIDPSEKFPTPAADVMKENQALAELPDAGDSVQPKKNTSVSDHMPGGASSLVSQEPRQSLVSSQQPSPLQEHSPRLAPAITPALNMASTLYSGSACSAQTVCAAKHKRSASVTEPKMPSKPQLDLQPVHGAKQRAKPTQGKLPFHPTNGQGSNCLAEKGIRKCNPLSSNTPRKRDYGLTSDDREDGAPSHSAKLVQYATSDNFIDLSCD
jgi:hypothetical protein